MHIERPVDTRAIFILINFRLRAPTASLAYAGDGETAVLGYESHFTSALCNYRIYHQEIIRKNNNYLHIDTDLSAHIELSV